MSKSIPAETVRGEGNSAIAPDTGRPLSRVSVMRFAIGFTFFSVLWAMSATMGSSMLLPQRFNGLGIGRPEAILGIMNSVGVLFALVANLVFGAFSDATHSRFGRRTPWILSGGFVAGLGFYLTSVSVTLTGIVGWSVVQQIGLNMMIAPCVAVFADRIPEMTRGTMSAFYGAGALIGQSLGNIIGAQFLGNVRMGFTFGVICWILSGVLTVLIFPREKAYSAMESKHVNLRNVLRQFKPPTKGSRDFWLALVGRMLLIFGYMSISGYQLYIVQKYIGLDNAEAVATISTMSLITLIISLVTSLASGPISDRIGKRKLPVFVSSAIIAIGIAVPWVLKSQFSMFAYAALMGLGYGIYMAVDQALNVDVLPNPDEAGKDLGILNLANTLGQVIAPIVVSSIVVATGGYFLVFPIAIAAVMVGAVVILFIKKVK